MEFMIVSPVQLDNNPPKSEINPSDFHVSTLSMDFSKYKILTKSVWQKRPTLWSIVHFSRWRERKRAREGN